VDTNSHQLTPPNANITKVRMRRTAYTAIAAGRPWVYWVR
jgi:hypothetical protein